MLNLYSKYLYVDVRNPAAFPEDLNTYMHVHTYTHTHRHVQLPEHLLGHGLGRHGAGTGRGNGKGGQSSFSKALLSTEAAPRILSRVFQQATCQTVSGNQSPWALTLASLSAAWRIPWPSPGLA